MKLLHLLSLIFALLFAGSAFAAEEFQIFSYDLSDNLVSVEAGNSVNVDAVVEIRNIGDAVGTATVKLDVEDAEGISVDSYSWTSPPLSVGPTASHTFIVSVPSSWEAGLYSFYVTVDDGSLPLHDQKLKTLTLVLSKPPPVPELPFFLLPLIAFSVLAFLFFAEKRHSGKL